MIERTTIVVVVAAVAVGVMVLAALARRLGWAPRLGEAWRDVWGSALDAARAMRTHPRVLWVAGILMVLSAASWLGATALGLWRLGGSSWQAVRGLAGLGAGHGVSTRTIFLVVDLPRQPGTVADYLSASTGGFGILEPFVLAVVLAALVVTMDTWVPAARERGAGASARLLRWWLAPFLALAGLRIYIDVGRINLANRGLPEIVLFCLPILIGAAWQAALAGALFTTARRALDGDDPWVPSAIAWGALHPFRSLFLLGLWVGLPGMLLFIVQTRLKYYGDAVDPIYTALAWVWVALVLAPAIIVSEGVGVIDSVRLALRGWVRVPLHLAVAIIGGVAVLWGVGLSGALIGGLLGESAAAGVAVRLGQLAADAVAVIWAAMVALVLWQRVRGRVMAQAPGGSL